MNGFTYDSNVKRFKELAKQYYKMQSEIRHLKEKIQSIDDRLLNYHSPTWDKIGSTPSRHELDVVGLIADKQEIEGQLQKLEGQCAWIQKCIDRIQDPYSRTIANLMYLGGYSINDISQEYSITPRHVFETTKDSLEQSLTDNLQIRYYPDWKINLYKYQKNSSGRMVPVDKKEIDTALFVQNIQTATNIYALHEPGISYMEEQSNG